MRTLARRGGESRCVWALKARGQGVHEHHPRRQDRPCCRTSRKRCRARQHRLHRCVRGLQCTRCGRGFITVGSTTPCALQSTRSTSMASRTSGTKPSAIYASLMASKGELLLAFHKNANGTPTEATARISKTSQNTGFNTQNTSSQLRQPLIISRQRLAREQCCMQGMAEPSPCANKGFHHRIDCAWFDVLAFHIRALGTTISG